MLNHPVARLLLCNDPAMGPLVSAAGLQPSLQGGKGFRAVRVPRLGVCEMTACTNAWPWNEKGGWEEGTGPNLLFSKVPDLRSPSLEEPRGDIALPSGNPSTKFPSPHRDP